MRLYNALVISAVCLATASPTWDPPHGKDCLSYDEALDISTRWLSVFSTGGVTSKAQLATIVTQNIVNYDDTFGPPNVGIDELWTLINPDNVSGKQTMTNIKQTPEWLFHTCAQIALRWDYTAITTGYESTVPAGTTVTTEGIELLQVDLKTRLVYNATSSADWILLAQQLGHKCTF